MNEKHFTRGYGLFENFLAEKRAQIADRLISPSLRKGKILDIGCGRVPNFLINTKFKEKHGIDLTVKKDGLKKGIMLKKLDMEKSSKWPFKNNFFDTITMLAVIEHIRPDRLQYMFKEVRRVLRPGGRFILTTPPYWSNRLLGFMAKLKLLSREEVKEHRRLYSRTSIKHLLYKTGFERGKIKSGYFVMFLNNWFYVDK